MEPLEELESCETLFLVGICEPFENRLQVLVQEARTQRDRPKQTIVAGVNLGVAYPIAPDANSRFFQLDWSGYIAYQVMNESYGKPLEGEVFAGKNLRVYAESAFLSYLKRVSYASSEYPGPFQHYEVISQMHVLGVAAENPPEIAILSREQIEAGVTAVSRVAFPR
jgi:hypothetical protein